MLIEIGTVKHFSLINNVDLCSILYFNQKDIYGYYKKFQRLKLHRYYLT